MRSLASFGTITRFSRIFWLVRVRMESTRAIVLTFARDTRQVVQRFTHIIRQIGNRLAVRLSRRKRSLYLDLSRHFLYSRLVNNREIAYISLFFVQRFVCVCWIASIQTLFILFYFVLFGSFVSVWVARLFVSKDRLFHAFHCQNNLSSVVSSTQDFVALNCFQPRMTLISAPCCEQVYVSFSAFLLANTTKRWDRRCLTRLAFKNVHIMIMIKRKSELIMEAFYLPEKFNGFWHFAFLQSTRICLYFVHCICM